MIDKKCKMSLMFILLTTTPLAFSATNSETVMVSMSGSIQPSICTATVQPTLTLGNIDEGDLTDSANAASSKSKTQMHIAFNGCEEGQNIQVSIHGTADTYDANIMANATGSEKSQNIGLAFLDSTNTLMAINTGKSPTVSATGGNASIDLDAIVVKANSSQAVTIGQADFTGQVKIDYL
jgi:type 1 fimbria pilin